MRGLSVVALGAAMVYTLYDYAGYQSVPQIGDEVIAPVRTIPLAVVIPILLTGAAYVALNLGVFGVFTDRGGELDVRGLASGRTQRRTRRGHDRHGDDLDHVFRLRVRRSARRVARAAYAAACDGDFLASFANLHGSKRFPNVSLLALGLLALPATLFPLDAVINALTAGLVLVQGVGCNLAVMVLRRRVQLAPFRSPFYPLPTLVALMAWLFMFWSSGPVAMAFGAATLASGAGIFLVRAHLRGTWPFALAASLLLALAVMPRPAGAATFTHARIVQRDGTPQLRVDGRPSSSSAARSSTNGSRPNAGAPRCSRCARSARTRSTSTCRGTGTKSPTVNSTSTATPTRAGTLRRVLALARELGFHLIVRPGPVIRNEWRNGGYPAWLLDGPDYDMPLHDVLEGRYPATATLQNAHARRRRRNG